MISMRRSSIVLMLRATALSVYLGFHVELHLSTDNGDQQSDSHLLLQSGDEIQYLYKHPVDCRSADFVHSGRR